MANKHETLVEELCAILQKKGAFNASEAQSIKKLFRERSQAAFDDFLLEEGLVRKEDLLVALSEYYQVPSFDVTGYFFSIKRWKTRNAEIYAPFIVCYAKFTILRNTFFCNINMRKNLYS